MYRPNLTDLAVDLGDGDGGDIDDDGGRRGSL